MELSPQTWRVLGLSVAIGYVGLGTFAATQSITAAKLLGLYPSGHVLPITEKPHTDSADGSAISHADGITTSMMLLGARDVSIGVALLTFDYHRMDNSLAILICSGMILCATDVFYIWKLRGPKWGSLFLAGAASWGVIGLGMLA